MDSTEFSRIRRSIDKTQTQLAQLLGISAKAVQSFEQGWRSIPACTERQLLFLLHLKMVRQKGSRYCWAIRKCPMDTRGKCPAWEFKAGRLCWFINGTICGGEVQRSWQRKMELCRQCEVFRSLFPLLF